MEWVWVGFGGMLGTLLRFWLSQQIQSSFLSIAFINCLGCSLLGIMQPFNVNIFLHKFLSVGFLGAFTTYSTFIFLSITLAQKHLFYGILYAISQVILAVICLWLGYKIGLLINEWNI